MSEALKDTPSLELHHRALYGNDKIEVMQKVGPNFGVTIQILAKEGDTYSHQVEDERTGLHKTLTGTVPKGSSDIEVSSQKKDMTDFWKAVNAERQSQDNSSNPPKI